MKPGQASRTAEYMALFRALETELPPDQRIIEDGYAFHFLSPTLRNLCSISKITPLNRMMQSYIDYRWPGARTSAIARTRFIDDVMNAELNSGIKQIVILGAGFDARAYRMNAAIHLFEVDHPSTSTAKRELLQQIPGLDLKHVHFVPVNFDSESLSPKMQDAGYDKNIRTLFIWEGVTNYLTDTAVDSTLNWCAQAAAQSKLVFTYVHKRVLDAPEEFYGTRKLFATLHAAGEKWSFGLDPSSVREFLNEREFKLILDLDANDYRQICYGRSANRMRGYEFYRIAVASVENEKH
jgi:methyltransferase (TIGR00027 family)